MYYLITPPYSLKWTDSPARVVEVYRDRGDLGDLEWRDAEEPHLPALVIHLAMRHGDVCSKGIAFPMDYVSRAERPAKLTSGLENIKTSEAKHAGNDQLMEALMPGWTEHGRQLMGQLEESNRQSVAEAEAEAAPLLEAPVRPDVVTAWASMGGMQG
ncbi:hypothetical protein ACTXM8_10360 [Brachybacterium alimentarium]|uniref:hypothetical protein n=1 Tax=Brachybacterium alimentarium TaxID=47845 RepID=UPI003FD1065F